MSTWHVSERLAAQYASGAATEPDAWSLEKHVESCGTCATRVSAAVRSGTAGPVLADVRAAVLSHATAPRAAPAHGKGAARPWARRLGLSRGGTHAAADGNRVGAEHHPVGADRDRVGAEHHPVRAAGAGPAPEPARAAGLRAARGGRLARVVWAAGPALRGSWLVAVVLVAAAAPALAFGAGFGGARPLLLAVAPVLPLAGVALSYGRHADPLYEVAAATPGGGLRLLLTRTAAVLAVSVPLLTAAGALLPAAAGVPGAAAWLLPGLALTLAALALGSYVGLRSAAAGLAAGWLGIVVAPVLATLPQDLAGHLERYVSGAAVQGSWAAAAVICAGLLAVRRSSVDLLEKM
ncbi:zf-HC2 domain-containing protein [Streptomyces sp. NBC_01142]|uniref:zf-HC2 domain-containing protein n=1 Tax=Streptomyces sp. NBC_01142 TaxID=2975865 RepID=UPI00224EB8AF|nr:zf-HC2 domain-containing protein [Streptomyces sp. NBC_01142]MCX4819338.1 zf-HC2 domain-containing protein [Streptomyces sp. NBC_01142]